MLAVQTLQATSATLVQSVQALPCCMHGVSIKKVGAQDKHACCWCVRHVHAQNKHTRLLLLLLHVRILMRHQGRLLLGATAAPAM